MKTYDTGQIAHLEGPEQHDEEDAFAPAKHRYHRSEKILGKLYRAVDEKEIWTSHIFKMVDTTGPSIWEQLLGLVQCEISDLGLALHPERRHDEAWRIRNLYDSTIVDKMWDFSDNPRKPLREVEVFCGFVFNNRGSQTRRQRDTSVKLKDETDRIMAWIVGMIRERGESAGKEDAVELCLACLQVGCVKDTGDVDGYSGSGDVSSFKVLAACCLLKEMTGLANAVGEEKGGGYVGVGGGAKKNSYSLPLRTH